MRVIPILGALLLGACGAYVAVDEGRAGAEGGEAGAPPSATTGGGGAGHTCGCPELAAPAVYDALECDDAMGMAVDGEDTWAVVTLDAEDADRAHLAHAFEGIPEAEVSTRLVLWHDDAGTHAAIHCGVFGAAGSAKLVVPGH